MSPVSPVFHTVITVSIGLKGSNTCSEWEHPLHLSMSDGLNTELLVYNSDHGLNNKLLVPFSGHGLNNELLSGI